MTNQDPTVNNMRDLWGKCDAYLRDAEAAGTAEVLDYGMSTALKRVETPGGLTISSFGELMSLRAEFDETNPGQVADLIYDVEFGPDVTELPEVYEDRYIGGKEYHRRTVPKKDFPGVAHLLDGLFEDF